MEYHSTKKTKQSQVCDVFLFLHPSRSLRSVFPLRILLLVLRNYVSQPMLFGVRDRQRPAVNTQLLGKLGRLVM